MLVLGSAQRSEVVDVAGVRRAGVEVARRRGGGGAVLLSPGAQVWADVWVPRDDPLWAPDPRRMAVRVGEWWSAALMRAGIDAAAHDERSVRTRWSDLVCFAGLGPGELTAGGRKLVGLTQWRSREGALVLGCVYRRFDPAALAACLAIDAPGRASLLTALEESVADLDSLGEPVFGAHELLAALPGGGEWEVVGNGVDGWGKGA